MVELLPLIGGACQILRACLSGVGSIAERKPGQNKEIKIDTCRNADQKTYIDTNTNLGTDEGMKKRDNFVKPVTVGPCALCSTVAAS